MKDASNVPGKLPRTGLELLSQAHVPIDASTVPPSSTPPHIHGPSTIKDYLDTMYRWARTSATHASPMPRQGDLAYLRDDGLVEVGCTCIGVVICTMVST